MCGCKVLHRVVQADLQLAKVKGECWSKDVSEALACLPDGHKLANMGTGAPQLLALVLKKVESDLKLNLGRVWSKVHGLDPRVDPMPAGCGRKLVSYDSWMAVPWGGEGRPQLPWYLSEKLPDDVMRNVARVRTSSHRLAVETGRWNNTPWRERWCTLCETGCIQDEKHVLLECSALEGVRNRYTELVENCGMDMKKLMQSKSAEACWLVHHCLRVTDEDERVRNSTNARRRAAL